MSSGQSGGGAQIPLPIQVGDKASFDNFWVGHNSELVAAVKASIQRSDPKLIYLYGPSSAGKSHLLFAAIRLAKTEIINTSYLALSDPRVSTNILEMVDVSHVVCIDDLQAWAGDEQREHALFALFEQIRHAGGQLLITANQPPDKCGLGLADLISRLASGLVYPLEALTEAQQLEAIKMRAQKRGLNISEEALRYLLRRSSRDTGELFSLLDKIDQASLAEKRRVTIPFLQGLIGR